MSETAFNQGDSVVVYGGMAGEPTRVATVGTVRKNGKFALLEMAGVQFRQSGVQAGGERWSRAAVRHATPERLADLERRNAHVEALLLLDQVSVMVRNRKPSLAQLNALNEALRASLAKKD